MMNPSSSESGSILSHFCAQPQREVRIVRRWAADPAAFPPEHRYHVLARVKASIITKKNLNPERRHRTCPRVVKRARHNSYRVKNPATPAPDLPVSGSGHRS
jgi:hypothetical protein